MTVARCLPWIAVLAVAAVSGALAYGCTDGTTPNCGGDAGCGTTVDATMGGDGGGEETSPMDSAPPIDSSMMTMDAPPDTSPPEDAGPDVADAATE